MQNQNKVESDPMLLGTSKKEDHVSKRRTLSQVIATIADSLLLLDLGMVIAVPTIIIGKLHNANGEIVLNDIQASWFSSIMMICQPLGSISCACIQGTLGRKKSMLLVNIPYLIGWYLLCSAQDVGSLYIASMVMGITMGFVEAPTLSYVGEISEPRLRGILATYANSNVAIGHLLEFILGYIFTWRQAMLVSSIVPITSIVAILLVPESPIWLLSKGKRDEAVSSLKWLRGWVSASDVELEFNKMEKYCQESKNEYITLQSLKNKKVTENPKNSSVDFVTKSTPTFMDGLKDLTRPGILKPMRLVIVYFFFLHCASLTAMRPYMIEVFTTLSVPISPDMLTVISAVLQCSGAFVCFCLVHLIGKRVLSLVSMTACSVCCISLGLYTYGGSNAPIIALLLFCCLYFFINVGISPIPWLLISEVFPTRGRGVASGVSAAMYYIVAFFVSKTWFNLEQLVDLHGCFLFYGVLASFGILFIYFCLPETEGKSLAEIEQFFVNKDTNHR